MALAGDASILTGITGRFWHSINSCVLQENGIPQQFSAFICSSQLQEVDHRNALFCREPSCQTCVASPDQRQHEEFQRHTGWSIPWVQNADA